MSKQRRRDTTLTIRLTKSEKERIERNAKRAGRSITAILFCCLWKRRFMLRKM